MSWIAQLVRALARKAKGPGSNPGPRQNFFFSNSKYNTVEQKMKSFTGQKIWNFIKFLNTFEALAAAASAKSQSGGWYNSEFSRNNIIQSGQ